MSERRGKDSLRAWIQLTKCAKRIEGHINGHFVGEHESSLARFDVLANLARCEGRSATPTVLSRMLLASKGNITRLLDRMEADGLVRRVADPTDGRASRIEMTRSGSALFARLAKVHEGWTRSVFRGLSDRELKQLTALLQKLRSQVDSA